MQQERALKILAEHRQAIADKYGVKRLGVFPYGEGELAGHASVSAATAAAIIRRLASPWNMSPEFSQDLISTD